MKKIILPLISLVGLALPLATSIPSKANAVEIEIGRPSGVVYLVDRDDYRYHHEHYLVFYRRPWHEHWHLAGRYWNRYAAEHEEHELRARGYYARVEREG